MVQADVDNALSHTSRTLLHESVNYWSNKVVTYPQDSFINGCCLALALGDLFRGGHYMSTRTQGTRTRGTRTQGTRTQGTCIWGTRT